MPSERKFPAVIRGMSASDLGVIADEYGGLRELPLSDEAYFAGFGLRINDAQADQSQRGAVPADSLPETVVNSTLVTLLNRPDGLYPLIGEEPPVDDMAILLEGELIDGIDKAVELFL